MYKELNITTEVKVIAIAVGFAIVTIGTCMIFCGFNPRSDNTATDMTVTDHTSIDTSKTATNGLASETCNLLNATRKGQVCAGTNSGKKK